MKARQIAKAPEKSKAKAPTHDDDAEITPEQLIDIESMLKMADTLHRQTVETVTLAYTLAMSVFVENRLSSEVRSLQWDYQDNNEMDPQCIDRKTASLSSWADNTSLAGFTLMHIGKLAIDLYMTKILKNEVIYRRLPELNRLDRLTMREANQVIEKLKTINTGMKNIADMASARTILTTLFYLVYMVFISRLIGSTPHLVALSLVASIFVLPVIFNDTRSIILNYKLRDKLLNKKNLLLAIFKSINEVNCDIHERNKIENSFFSFNLQNILSDKASAKSACPVIYAIFKKYGFNVTMSLKHLAIAINADIYMTPEIAEKMNQDIHAQLDVLDKISQSKEQLVKISNHLNLFFTWFYEVDGIRPIFYVQTTTAIGSNVIEDLKSLFGDDFTTHGNIVKIIRTTPLTDVRFNDFINNTKPKMQASSDVIFLTEQASSTKNIYQHISNEPSDDESTQLTQLPVAIKNNTSNAAIIRWPSGAMFDPSKPAKEQNVKKFISSGLPDNTIFATLCLTKEDFRSSSNEKMYDRFKKQVDNPTIATKRKPEGFALNDAGTVRIQSGQLFEYTGKVKIQGHEFGDARCYFDYETDPQTGAVLCNVKGWKAKAHKKREMKRK